MKRLPASAAFAIAGTLTQAITIARLFAATAPDTMIVRSSLPGASWPAMVLFAFALAYAALPRLTGRDFEGAWARAHLRLTAIPLLAAALVGTLAVVWARELVDPRSFLHLLITRSIAVTALRALLPGAFVIGQGVFVIHLVRTLAQRPSVKGG